MKVKSSINLFIESGLLKSLDEKALLAAVSGAQENVRPLAALFELQVRGYRNLTPVYQESLKSDDADLRTIAVAALGTNLKKNQKAVIAALKDNSPQVVRRAVEAIGRQGGKTELKKLVSLQPENALVQQSVKAAQTLLAYRLGESRYWLQPPDEGNVLQTGNRKTVEIKTKATSLEKVGLSQSIREIIPGAFRDQALDIQCQQWKYLLVLGKNAKGKGENIEGVAGVLLRQEAIDKQYHRYGYLLSHPKDSGERELFVMRESGEVAYYGELVLEEKSWQFKLQALNSRHTRPIELSGGFDPVKGNFNVERAWVAVEKSGKQPAQIRPRPIQRPRAVSL